jgi:hypothetical protein
MPFKPTLNAFEKAPAPDRPALEARALTERDQSPSNSGRMETYPRPTRTPPAPATAHPLYRKGALHLVRAYVIWIYITEEGKMNESYESAYDALVHMGPELTEFVTEDELQKLVDGRLAPAEIADRYYDEMGIADGMTLVETNEAETRSDLLMFVRHGIEVEIEQRKQQAIDDAATAAVQTLATITASEQRLTAAIHREKMEFVAEARRHGAAKGAIAEALGITRPTLDKWIADYERD